MNIYHMVQMIVFDMAGTTVDEDNMVYKTLQKAIDHHGYTFSLEKVLAEGAGKEKQEAVKSILALNQVDDPSLSDKIYQHFLLLLDEAYQYLDVRPQPNALEVFHRLKENKITVVLNTGYNRATALKLIEKLGWVLGQDYDGLVTASDVHKNRPDPDMILLAMQKFGIIDPKEVIKVGDSFIDIQEGQRAGCLLSIGITTGAHDYKQLQLARPDYIIDDLLELLPIVEKS
jgi:phosphonatase-like hydrolase